jgi:uncharacterized protein (TIRG00374 family)
MVPFDLFFWRYPLRGCSARAFTDRMKILRTLGILLGITLVGWLIHEVGLTSIKYTDYLLCWGYAIILLYPCTGFYLTTLGWRWALHPGYPVRLRTMLAVRLAGETFNSLLPSSYIGGEPVKAKLLSKWIPLREAASSVLIAKAAQSVGLLIYIGLGLVLGLPATAASAQRLQVWLALAVLSVGVSLFIILLANQSFTRFGRALQRLTGSKWLQKQETRLASLDESLGAFYRHCKGRFFASILWHGLGWIVGMLELVIIFQLMGNAITWRQAWFMGALAQLGSVLGLISPGGIGFYEGGHYMAALLLGLPPTLGVSASLIRRVREIFWDLIGLYFFNIYSKNNHTV